MKKILSLLLIFTFLVYSDTQKESSNPDKAIALAKISKVYVDYEVALNVAKEEKKNIFILFQTEHCRWCKKLKATTLQDSVLTERLNNEFVVLVLDKEKSEYPSTFKIKGVPTVYMISNKGVIFVERVGYYENPKDYTKWFDYVKIESGL